MLRWIRMRMKPAQHPPPPPPPRALTTRTQRGVSQQVPMVFEMLLIALHTHTHACVRVRTRTHTKTTHRGVSQQVPMGLEISPYSSPGKLLCMRPMLWPSSWMKVSRILPWSPCARSDQIRLGQRRSGGWSLALGEKEQERPHQIIRGAGQIMYQIITLNTKY